MSTTTISSQSVSKWLGKWYKSLIRHQLQEATGWKVKVDGQIMDMEEDQTLLIYYSLLTLRHNLLTRQENPNNYLKSINPFEEKSGPMLTHYYHLFTGMCEALEGNYTEALRHYSAAEEYLDKIPDDKEKAEFHFRVANVYYHIRQTSLAFKHGKEAKAIFDVDPDYLQRSAHCEILLGLCYLTNKDFELAQDHLETALDIAIQLNSDNLKIHIRYNFGFLFAEKGDSRQAIEHLEMVDAVDFDKAATSFLLAREFFKTGRLDDAFNKVNQGMEVCEKTENTEYQHHFKILKAFHDGSSVENIETAVKEGVAYFKKHQLYGYADDYLTKLANYVCENNDYRNTDVFF
ncbi:MAG TPA: tetratricopeptide repeat protein [Bacillales bacterium]